jgi:hypothetical protein
VLVQQIRGEECGGLRGAQIRVTVGRVRRQRSRWRA